MNCSLEQTLCRLHQRKYCLLVGNATAGIYLALKSRNLIGGYVAVPNSVCPNVPLAIYLAGCTPVYLDIDEDNFGLNPSQLNNNLSIDVVVAVHAYGVACSINKIQDYCNDNNIFLIEDVAVAQGASIDSQPLGAFGDVSVLSFGAGKIIDVGVGGALLTDDYKTYETLRDHNNSLSEYNEIFSEKINKLGNLHTDLYNNIYLEGERKKIPEKYKEKAINSSNNFLYKFPEFSRKIISEKLEDILSVIRLRRDNYQVLFNLFEKSNIRTIKLIDVPNGSVPWRFNMLIDKERNRLLRKLLKDDFKVSSWYPSIDVFFNCRVSANINTSVSDDVSEKILNLWVNEEIDINYLNKVHKRIVQFLTV